MMLNLDNLTDTAQLGNETGANANALAESGKAAWECASDVLYEA